MNILVINGSPKGKYSITLQTLRYLERKFKDHRFNVLNAGQTIRAIEIIKTNIIVILKSKKGV